VSTPGTHRRTPADELAQTHVGTEMTTGVIHCVPGDSVIALARRMAIYHTHAVVIAGLWADDESYDLRWGLISHEEVVHALVDGRHDVPAADLNAGRAVTCDRHETVLTAARRMGTEGVDHLVVLDGDEPVGVISTLDVMRVAGR
jgi:CBS domain-containing protein